MTGLKDAAATSETVVVAEPPVTPNKPNRLSKLTQRFPFLKTKRGVASIIVMLAVIIGAGLAGLAALPHGGGVKADSSSSNSSSSSGVITSDTYFYGQSPPVYPSPNMTGSGAWAAAYVKAQAMVSQMTLEEKVNLTAGVSVDNGCSGAIPAIERLGFPGLCLNDAGNGLRGTDFVSSWPSGVHVGASWNRDLAYQRGAGMGGEYKTKGVNVILGPVVGPLGRVAEGGRNWEGFSVDPYLGGALVYETVSAIQKAGVITSTKHFIGYEQETYRGPEDGIQSVSSNLDDQTMHEVYLWPFQDAVHAGSANIMCSYNRVNNSYGCANSKTLNGLLKTELGFNGWVVSDWDGQHAGVATANAGLDVAMPNGDGYWGDNLTQAVNNGSVSESRVTDMATRIIASWYQMGQDKDFPTPGIGMPEDLTAPHTIIDGRDPAFRPTLLNGAIEGHVLLKNTNNALPLNKPRMLSVFGYSAKNPETVDVTENGWSMGSESFSYALMMDGFLGEYDTVFPAIAINGTIYSGGGSGANSWNTGISPFDGILYQAHEDNTQLFWDFSSTKPAVNPASDACLVIVNAFASESFDRPNLHDDYTDGLILNVADNCNNTIVVFQNAGIRLVDQFIDHENITALIFGHLPGQDSGKALTQLLYGQANPSGKLPYTIAKNESDYAVLSADWPEGIYEYFPQSNFTEGVYVDYRYFDAKNITPRYEFGFGLSYTTFEYSNIVVSKTTNLTATYFDQYPSGEILEGGQTDLWDVLASVKVDIANTGSVDGAEVAQLYVAIPDNSQPERVLRGFEKPFIGAGQTKTVGFDLTRRDLSVWDAVAQKWSLVSGEYTIYVGSSSRTLPLTGTLSL